MFHLLDGMSFEEGIAVIGIAVLLIALFSFGAASLLLERSNRKRPAKAPQPSAPIPFHRRPYPRR